MSGRRQESSVRDSLDALEWCLLSQARRKSEVQSRDWWISAVAALSAVALHAMLLAPLAFGVAVRTKRTPDEQGSGSSAVIASAEMVPTLTLISLSSAMSRPETALLELASRGIAPPQFSLIIASPDADLAFEEEALDSDEQIEAAVEELTVSGAERAALFGRYIGQVAARIERAWLRPRAALASGRFECHTRIEQDGGGNVLSIELLSCNDDALWQQSLVSAIERASPLSGPPEPSVFSSTLLLNFKSEQYEEGLSAESEYESKLAVVGTSLEQPYGPANQFPERFLEELRGHKGPIELTIIGKDTRWTLGDIEESRVSTTQAGIPGD